MSNPQPIRTSPAPDAGGIGLPYFPGIDGLRALAVGAVGAVVLYHADAPLPGGFLGVEVFFVLSGYLITALLRAEWQQTGALWYAPESGVLITVGLTQTDIDPNAIAARALDVVLRAQGR